MNQVARSCTRVVEHNKFFTDKLLEPRSGKCRKFSREKLVQPQSCRFFRHNDLDDFYCLCHVDRSGDIFKYFRNSKRFLDFARNDKKEISRLVTTNPPA